MSTNDSQRGYSIDTGRRRKKQLGLGILAVVIVAIVAVIVVMRPAVTVPTPASSVRT